MKKTLLVALFFAMGWSPLSSQETRLTFDKLETNDGRTYSGVTIQKTYPDRVTFMHESGAVTLPWNKLPEEIVVRIKSNADANTPGPGSSPLADPYVPPYPLKLDSLLTLDGQSYQGVAITNVGILELSFQHSQGSASVPFARLPEGIRQQYLYDPAKAESYIREVKGLLEEKKQQSEAGEARKREEAAARAAKKEPIPDPASATPGSLAGAWQRRLGKNLQAVKTYGFGRVSVTIYDSKGKVINQNHGTWKEGAGLSVEKIICATDNWSFLIGRTIRHEVQFSNPNTAKLTNEQGGVEEWTRIIP